MAFTQITWTGALPVGGTAWTRFKFAGDLDSTTASTAAANTRTLLNTFVTYFPTGLVWTCTGTAVIYDIEGILQSEVAIGTVPNTITGTSSAVYAAGVGLLIHWETGAVVTGAKVRGGTYIVPLTSLALENNGTLAQAPLGSFRTAATAFATSTPSPAVFTKKTTGAGVVTGVSPVTGATITDKVAMLRSRRD